MNHPEFGKNQLTNFINKLTDIAKMDREPHFEGRQYVTTVIPIQKKENT